MTPIESLIVGAMIASAAWFVFLAVLNWNYNEQILKLERQIMQQTDLLIHLEATSHIDHVAVPIGPVAKNPNLVDLYDIDLP